MRLVTRDRDQDMGIDSEGIVRFSERIYEELVNRLKLSDQNFDFSKSYFPLIYPLVN